ncbi:MAG: hypothetical protein R3F14_33930 [Polyangiaceae bacterium]
MERSSEAQKAIGLERFEEDMVIHLREFVPKHSEVIGEEWVRRSIRVGIQRARSYGVTNPGLLRFYVELMFMFGGRFDRSAVSVGWRYPLSPTILNGGHMDRLYDATQAYLNATGRLGHPVARPDASRPQSHSFERFLPATDPRLDDMLLEIEDHRADALRIPR